MSQQVDVTVNCPNCGNSYNSKLFRTVWGEHESLRSRVMNDEINILECPHCHHSFHAPMAMLYVDAVKKFAVWWEPAYDSQIDEMTAGFSRMLGSGNYYENAPRITDWHEFKETINKYYRGELKGQSEEVSRRQSQAMINLIGDLAKSSRAKQSTKSGCLSSVILIVVIASVAMLTTVCLLEI